MARTTQAHPPPVTQQRTCGAAAPAVVAAPAAAALGVPAAGAPAVAFAARLPAVHLARATAAASRGVIPRRVVRLAKLPAGASMLALAPAPSIAPRGPLPLILPPVAPSDGGVKAGGGACGLGLLAAVGSRAPRPSSPCGASAARGAASILQVSRRRLLACEQQASQLTSGRTTSQQAASARWRRRQAARDPPRTAVGDAMLAGRMALPGPLEGRKSGAWRHERGGTHQPGRFQHGLLLGITSCAGQSRWQISGAPGSAAGPNTTCKLTVGHGGCV